LYLLLIPTEGGSSRRTAHS